MIEFLISLVILTLAVIALSNMVVLFIHRKVKTAVIVHTADAAKNLALYPDKVKNCQVSDPCNGFNICQSSIYCDNDSVCTSSSACIVCYTNPDNGKKIYYSFNSSELQSSNNTYVVTLCWKYAGDNGTYTTIITLYNNTQTTP